MTYIEKLNLKHHIRLVKQRRKIGGPFILQEGEYRRHPTSGHVAWYTIIELGDYKTREAAIESLR